ncbi:MAG: hypothetical protein QOE61_1100, partial [Micromonosporaceae bacterium]|nr:hypothetical protein [Micromonosporaceae bacterium]
MSLRGMMRPSTEAIATYCLRSLQLQRPPGG